MLLISKIGKIVCVTFAQKNDLEECPGLWICGIGVGGDYAWRKFKVS